MSHMRSKIITSLAAPLVIAAAVAPSAGASERTATELGQSTDPAVGASERTATELGQSTDSPPASRNGLSHRTTTELGQSTNLSSASTSSGESGGFDWGDAAIVGSGAFALVLVGLGGVALLNRRRGGIRKSRTPVASS
jgi:hypothetical protein